MTNKKKKQKEQQNKNIERTNWKNKSKQNVMTNKIKNNPREQKYLERENAGQNSGFPLFPLVKEILTPAPTDLKPLIIEGCYISPEHYLNNQLKLLREDFIAPLREGIKHVRRGFLEHGELHENEYITLYPHCRFLSISAVRKVVGYQLCFDVEHQIVPSRLKKFRCLYTGTLLVISADKFRTFFFGTIIQTEDQDIIKDRVITVELFDGKTLSFNEFNTSYVIAEPVPFYAPYLYVMKSLQSFSNDRFPFKKYIIGPSTDIACPAYTKRYQNRNNPSILDKASGEDLGLNPIQFEAYTSALSRELAIIQGPPGTGKTHVGLRIVKSLLNQLLGGPILLVCYTNHALDQFLQGVLGFTQNVLRLGYSKRNTQVKPYNHIEMLETFVAISRIVRKKNLRRYENMFVKNEDFDLLFGPSRRIYTLTVYSFKNDRAEQRSYSGELLRALFFMYTQSRFNHPTSVPKKNILKACKEYQRSIERLGLMFKELGNPRGIVDLKYLESAMDDVSVSTLNKPGVLEMWLTKGSYQSRLYELRKEQINYERNFGIDNKETSTEELKDVEEVTLYTLDLRVVRKEIDNFAAILKECNDKPKNRRVASQEAKIRTQLEEQTEMCEFVERSLYALIQGNDNTKPTGMLSTIRNGHDLVNASYEQRWNLYWHWVTRLRQTLHKQMEEEKIKYKQTLLQFEQIIRQPELLDLMKTKQVVALTTTKAAKIHPILCELKPKVIVIEEAAEVLEAHILASLTPYCEHLILIGDHKQLRPRTSVHELARDFNLDVSLFERLINNGFHHVTLQVQHRMRPEICSLLTPTIYETLSNHKSVTKLPWVRGMAGNIQFFDHKFPEESDPSEKRTWNTFEVVMMLSLAEYLIKQNYKARSITIIAAYIAQVDLFEDTLANYPHLSGVHITTIDSYQGEENDIILLSLVRNNAQNNVGFLKNPNRVCVALSRAKQGLYIMGNMTSLSKQSELWTQIKKKLESQGAISNCFKLKCRKCGRGTKAVTHALDFNVAPYCCV
uniref:NFX1-type zinc finger-containing protein 1 n=1 Tax=Cacopsylla melanoneura TaxID=428564 RepID=A0A8D9EVL1_9HEMI